MARKMLIDATHSEETRVVVVNGNKVEEFDFDATARGLITGNIYLAKVTRVEPSLQAAFVDYGGNRHGFLAFSEIHPDYYQIPQADRDALMQEEIEHAEAEDEEEDQQAQEDAKPKKSRSRSRRSNSRNRNKAEGSVTEDKVQSDIVEGESVEAENVENESDAPKPEAPKSDSDEPIAEIEVATDNSKDVDAQEEPITEVTEDVKDSEDAKPKKSRSRKRPARKSAESVLDDPRDADGESSDVEEVSTSDDDEVRATRNRPSKSRAPRVRPHNRYQIQEVVKVRQIILVQVIKEERGNKGAALTTYLSLPGRYCVLMPNTARGGGISRKVANIQDRKRLKTLVKNFNVPKGAGLIIRTAGAKEDSAEIERDYAFLTRQWNKIRELTLASSAPTAVYAESGPIKRAIRDLLTTDTEEVLVEGQKGFDEAQEYMNIIMPERVNDVKLYEDTMPLFSRYQVESYLAAMFNPIVQLPSGGYLVFGVTEALIAVDVNSGRSTKESSIEETAVKTNLEAATEVARQLKLRDLAGLVVIDFIDMEQRRHQSDVESRLKEALRKDRARIQVGRISSFGLLEMSRQRLRTGLAEATTLPCPHCSGTGIQRSDDSLALAVIRAIEEEIARGRSNQIAAHVPMDVANFLFNEKRDHINGFEERHGVTVKIVADPEQIAPNYKLEKSKISGKPVPKAAAPITAESVMESVADDEAKPAKRRRRRGGKGRNKNANNENNSVENNSEVNEDSKETNEAQPVEVSEENVEEKPKKRTRSRRKPKADVEVSTEEVKSAETAPSDAPSDTAEEKPAPKKRAPRKTKAQKDAEISADAPDEVVKEKPKRTRRKKADDAVSEETKTEEKPKKARKKAPVKKAKKEETAKAPVIEEAPIETKSMSFEPEAPAEKPKPKKKGWWSL